MSIIWYISAIITAITIYRIWRYKTRIEVYVRISGVKLHTVEWKYARSGNRYPVVDVGGWVGKCELYKTGKISGTNNACKWWPANEYSKNRLEGKTL